jgi:hypothetical protein
MKKIISYALWGNQKLYVNGAISNIINRDKFYPGWICRFYVDETTLPKTVIDKILTFPNVEVIHMGHAEDVLGMFWRFRPLFDDPEIERFLVRDTDSQPTKREADAVNEWIESGLPFHIIRDNHYHGTHILGGTWGAVPGILPDTEKKIEEFLLTVKETKSQHPTRKYHGADQFFLSQVVWPVIKDNHLAHVRADEPGLLLTGKERILPPLEEGGHFVGMPCDLVDGEFKREESYLIVNEQKYNKICLMVPTYKRPLRLMSLIDSALRLAEDPSRLRFSFCVNEADRETKDYLVSRYWPVKDSWEVINETSQQPNLSLYFNLMYKNTQFKDALISELGDDMVFMTKNWDVRILDEINRADGKVIVYADDSFVAHEKCCVNLFTTRKMVEATKKPFMCEFFHADMIDMIWTMLGSVTGTLRYLPDVIIQHNHSTRDPEDKWDETFKRLSPIQKVANKKQNQKLAIAYTMLCAKNLIEAGIGKWNVLL